MTSSLFSCKWFTFELQITSGVLGLRAVGKSIPLSF